MLEPLAEMSGHLLRRAATRHHQIWAERVDDRLTSAQFAALEAMVIISAHNETPDQQTIAQAAGLDRSTSADLLRRLETGGWLVRRRDETDRRRMLLALTHPAEVAVRALSTAVDQVQDELCVGLTTEEREWLMPRWWQLGDTGASSVLPDRPGHALRRAQQRHSTLWTQMVSTKTTSVQFAALVTIDREGVVGQAELSEAAGIDRSSTSTVLARLNQRGLIRRGFGQDRRQRTAELTEQGTAVLKELWAPAQALQSTLLEPVAESDRARVMELLHVVSTGQRTELN